MTPKGHPKPVEAWRFKAGAEPPHWVIQVLWFMKSFALAIETTHDGLVMLAEGDWVLRDPAGAILVLEHKTSPVLPTGRPA